ncbi:MAG: hypothetical protein AVDCRST_MAG93-5753, partial [uncultured Chloroflexia bacterium]
KAVPPHTYAGGLAGVALRFVLCRFMNPMYRHAPEHDSSFKIGLESFALD